MRRLAGLAWLAPCLVVAGCGILGTCEGRIEVWNRTEAPVTITGFGP